MHLAHPDCRNAGRDLSRPGCRPAGAPCRIERGVADRIGAVLWFSDLRHFTQVADHVEPELLIPFLNDYADAIISSIHEAGGDVLKLIGDGTLAVFQAGDAQEACRGALSAHRLARSRLENLNRER